jgi:ribosomal protein S18 acetylase RimI-like enzyme
MAVLLKNLLARAPYVEDLVAISELVKACDIAEFGVADSTMEDLVSNWHQSSFNLAQDAWVIVTNTGRLVGFACVWHRDYEQISTFVCVHPEFRSRGIGTLLLRLVEERARQHVRNAQPGIRVSICGIVNSLNEQAKRLFEREGYTQICKTWRIAVGPNDSIERSSRHSDIKADLEVDLQRLVGATQLYDLDAIYIMREYDVYEKELRAGDPSHKGANDELDDDLKMLVSLR